METPIALQATLFDIDPVPIYFLLLTPSEPMYSKVMEAKKVVDDFTGGQLHQARLPHVTLAQFPMPEQKEKQLVASIRDNDIISSQTAQANGLKVFENINTIYVSLAGQAGIHTMTKTLISRLAMNHLLPRKKGDLFKSTDLHITIAKRLSPADVDPLVKKLSVQTFVDDVHFTKMLLLKGIPGTPGWKEVAKFPLNEKN